MKVKELIEQLRAIENQDMEVVTWHGYDNAYTPQMTAKIMDLVPYDYDPDIDDYITQHGEYRWRESWFDSDPSQPFFVI